MNQILIVGRGEVPRRALLALLDDYMDSVTEPVLLLVIDTPQDDDLPLVTAHVARWAMAMEHPFEVVIQEDLVNRFADKVVGGSLIDTLLSAASVLHSAKHPATAAARMLKKSDSLLVAWDDEDPVCGRVVTVNARRGGPTPKDLTNALAEIEVSLPTENNDSAVNQERAPSVPVPGDRLTPGWVADLLETLVAQMQSAISTLRSGDVAKVGAPR